MIYSNSTELAENLRDRIAPSGGIHLQTKYYTVSVPVTIMAPLESGLPEEVKGIILVEDPKIDSAPLLMTLSGQEEDRIKIFLTQSEDSLDACIDHGFELVTYSVGDTDLNNLENGIGRVIEALKCRMWESDEPSTCSSTPQESNSDSILDSFESLISQMQQVRLSSTSLSDSERRSKAESIASQLAKLLCDDSDDEDVTVT